MQNEPALLLKKSVMKEGVSDAWLKPTKFGFVLFFALTNN